MYLFANRPSSARPWQAIVLVALAGLWSSLASAGDLARPANLPLPTSLSVAQYEALLFEFLNQRNYKTLGWASDKRVRDTGPYINGKEYGTHPAVKIYYSPEIIQWLVDGKQDPIPDGTMIVKEQFEAPAARYEGLDDEQLFEHLSSWTVMVKDAAGSHDGWFWSNPAKNQQVVNNHRYPFDHPISGFGIYCVRCHASTKTHGATNEYTFASLRNIAGYPGEPLLFRVDDSWRETAEVEEPGNPAAESDDGPREELVDHLAEEAAKQTATHPRCSALGSPERCQPALSQPFLRLFPTIAPRDRDQVEFLPPVTHDWVVRRSGDRQARQPFVTSNQCMSCHAGLLEPFGPAMFVTTSDEAAYGAPGVHVSPYGEWRWTPMGLAGRDPVFFAQLESEIELMREDFADDRQAAEEHIGQLVETCLSCHGAMGKHQYRLDHGSAEPFFGLDHITRASTDEHARGRQDWRYGALARDGVSCTVCHHMQPRPQPADDPRPYLQFFLETSTTGRIHLGDPNELHGPFEDKEIAPYSMEHALGFKPKHNPYVKSSRMCGTCHVVNLPIVDRPAEHEDALIAAEQNPFFKKYHHHVEQATYLEWLNSEYENEVDPENPQARTCQDCHMSRDYRHEQLELDLDRLETRMAVIQDASYPDAENLAEHEALNVRIRKEGYARHNFRGLNVFLLEMFNQFDDVLGVRKYDFMTGSQNDIQHAVDDFVRQARHETAEIDVAASIDGASSDGPNSDGPRVLTARVEVRNKTGHRFPTGVGFRRAFIELLVVETPADGQSPQRVVWSSGRTNELGVLIDHQGEPLASELFTPQPDRKVQRCQHHYDTIDSDKQVQIYETLLHSTTHRYTTSFIHGSEVVKDNRLLPRGWKAVGPGGGLEGQFLAATHPGPEAQRDPRYLDGSGADEVVYRVGLPDDVDAERIEVQASLYYQAMPPYFLQSLFETAPNGPATQRLHYIASNIDLKGTPIEDWKLRITTARTTVTTPARD